MRPAESCFRNTDLCPRSFLGRRFPFEPAELDKIFLLLDGLHPPGLAE